MSARSADLSGQVALVTGGGRGIGREMASELAARGASVGIVSRSQTQLEQTVAAIDSNDGSAVFSVADLTDERAVRRSVQELVEALGPVDLLVNNAGWCSAIGPVWEVDPDAWWRDFEVNVRAAFLCTRAVLPPMLSRRAGRIVNVSSYAVVRPDPYTSGYSAAKAALTHFTASLAAEVAEHRISVFAVAPGTVKTELTHHLATSPEGRRWLTKFETMPDDYWLPPERCAELVAALASGKADRLSGRLLHALDDLDDLVARADDIVEQDLYALHLRKLAAT